VGHLLLDTWPLPLWAWGPLVLEVIGLLGAEEFRKLLVNRFVVSTIQTGGRKYG